MFTITFQKIENAVIALSAFSFFLFAGGRWIVFFLFLLAVDISMIGYLVNPRMGAYSYNIAHSYTLPGLFLVLTFFLKSDFLYGILLIWIAHIGMDRALGYGLKAPTSFKETHLGKIGK